MRRLVELLPNLSYDVCVLTGDYRGPTFGPFDATLEGLKKVRSHLTGPIYGVLGNHDTIRMVPGLEEMGIRVLLNECEVISRGGRRLYLAGIDDAHYYRVDNIEKAAANIPQDGFSILLSHTPEIYRQAAHAGFNLLLGGHTHGGQICSPGSVPITLDSILPRRMGSGAWKYNDMIGYTSVGVGSSVVAVRINCLPEITLHHLRSVLNGSRANRDDRGRGAGTANAIRAALRRKMLQRSPQRPPSSATTLASRHRQQGFGNLVESGRSAAWDQTEAALKEAGEQVASHSRRSHHSSNLEFEADKWRACCRHQDSHHDSACGL